MVTCVRSVYGDRKSPKDFVIVCRKFQKLCPWLTLIHKFKTLCVYIYLYITIITLNVTTLVLISIKLYVRFVFAMINSILTVDIPTVVTINRHSSEWKALKAR